MSDQKPSRDNIPLPIKREVRQRCGFGCVFCGLPLYDYDHLLGWANTKRHVADELTLLCTQHHREKTNGLLSSQQVEKANASPHNLREGVSKPYLLHFEGDQIQCKMGGTDFSAEVKDGFGMLVPIVIDGEALLAIRIEDNHLLLTMSVYDRYNKLVLAVLDNHLVFRTDPRDIELSGSNLTVREGARKLLLKMKLLIPDSIEVERAVFMKNGVEFETFRDKFVVKSNNGQSQMKIRKAKGVFCFVLGSHDVGPCVFRFAEINRYPQAANA